MTAAEIVPYRSPNSDLSAEVERLRLQVAQYEGAGGAIPDHQYDRYASNAFDVSHATSCKAISGESLHMAQDQYRLR